MGGLSIILKGTSDEKYHMCFDIYDVEKTGYISKSEMRKVLTAMNVVLRATESQNRAFSEADVETFVKTLFEEAGANDRLNRQSVSHYHTPSRKPTAHAHTELPLHSHRQVKLRRLCQGRQEPSGDNRFLSGEQVGHAGPHATPHSPIVGHVLARCGSTR